ncbi:MAG TPA: universal stress protein, partial [Gemmatimonadaceae bacterium]|nr:universal stress protein [Gemmatimonadaceae bacterium]
MRPDVIAPPTSRHAALIPDVSSARTGPVTVAVGQTVDGTLRAGALVAHRLGRGIAVISVIEPAAVYLWNTPSVPIPPSYEEDRSLSRWSYLEEQMRAAAMDGPTWSVEVFWGGISRTVARAAHDLRAPLIVMGLGRHRPVDRLLGGETALRTIRQADCPVLAVSSDFDALPRVVAAGTDFSYASAHALRAALPLLAPNATVHLVHVWQPAARFDLIGTPYDERYRHELPGRIVRFTAALDLPKGVTLRTHVLEGRPADRLLAIAEDVGAELIVVGRHGRGVLERLLVGSVATRVLRGATRSVLVVPEPAPGARLQLSARHGATTNVIAREEWASFLDRFTRHFAGRIVALDVNDPSRGLRTQERGSVLFGASYDPRENRLEIILGEPNGRRRHLTRVIPDPSDMSALLSPAGDEEGIHVLHGTGEIL